MTQPPPGAAAGAPYSTRTEKLSESMPHTTTAFPGAPWALPPPTWSRWLTAPGADPARRESKNLPHNRVQFVAQDDILWRAEQLTFLWQVLSIQIDLYLADVE